ncbi:hypothetical protein [Halomonas denitrificans]|nr:hypothetical protein [Halomonas denitrificans]
MHRRPTALLTFAFLLCLSPSAGAIGAEMIEGRVDVLWGDPPPGSGAPSQVILTLTDDHGGIVEFGVSEQLAALNGGFLAWNGRRVRVHLAAPAASIDGSHRTVRRALALTLLEDRSGARGGVVGSQPWVSILCKFADIPDEPRDRTYFQDMYANAFGGLDDYWRKQSYGTIDIVGSTAVDWVDLPQPQGFYVPDPGNGSNSNRNALFNDCTAAADPFVDYSNGGTGGFSGINQMFNAELDCCAWGGGRFATLDGVTKSWRVTWEPPWAYAQSGVIAHEMGHGFGLPHANNFDNDGNPYDSPWDVMSSATGNAVDDPTFGRLGKHHTAFHKDILGWFAASEVLEVLPDSSVTVIVDAMTVPSTANLRMIRVPILGTDDWYTVEARALDGYDGNLPGNAVIISHVDTSRSEPAWAVDTADPPANYGANEGTMFRVGETFVSPDGRISIAIDSATVDGFEITVTSVLPELLFEDGFESNRQPLRLPTR